MKRSSVKRTASVVLPYNLGNKDGFVYVKTAKEGRWGLPAGKLEPLESPRSAIIREAFEETGLDIKLTFFLGTWHFRSDRGSAISNMVYSGEVIGGDWGISRPKEILDLDVLSLREIMALHDSGNVRAGKNNLIPVQRYVAGGLYPLSPV